MGPDDGDCVTTSELVDLFCKYWGEGVRWEKQTDVDALHEADYLKLDCSKIKVTFEWKQRWHIEDCVRNTVEFSRIWLLGGSIPMEMDREIKDFFEG